MNNTKLYFEHVLVANRNEIIDISQIRIKDFLKYFHFYINDECDLLVKYTPTFCCTLENFKDVDNWIRDNNRKLQITIIERFRDAIKERCSYVYGVSIYSTKFNEIKEYYNSLFNELTDEEKLLLILDD